MNLFEQNYQQQLALEAPLATRMRPQTLEEFIGQTKVVGPGTLLRRAIEADQLSSLIFYGPPGTGKTTLARIIARRTNASFEQLSAVAAGVNDLKKVIQTAKDRRGMYQQKTIVFIDEIHRFNKAQQDALLPHVEDGTVILIGATTENPYFEINPALLSRSLLVELQPLTDEELRQICERALRDPVRGLGKYRIKLDDDAFNHLVHIANGDARIALNTLEWAMSVAQIDAQGVRHITLPLIEESMQKRAVVYGKNGDQHYDTISALIKSMRGSDPDAALYWLAKMLHAGEDPKYIARRIVICAAEDVGNADPQALLVATAAAQAVMFVGMPEARIPLAQAVTYIATAPKSNAAYLGIDAAYRDVAHAKSTEVPLHLRDTSYQGASRLGHGKGYKYPHDYPQHFVVQQYLPEHLLDRHYYRPTHNGYEEEIAKRLAAWRQKKEK